MGYIGRKLRERRILFPQSQRGLIVPVDHGFTLGPILGMKETGDFEGWISSSNISAVLAHKGVIERLILRGMLHSSTGVIVHLNGMMSIAPDADTKVMVSNIDTALQLGADAVSVQVNFTAGNFHHNIALLGAVTDAAHAAGLPILIMLYDKVKTPSQAEAAERLHHLLRVVAEMGADAIKLAFPDSDAVLADLVARHSRDIRIFFAGGENTAEEVLMAKIRVALAHGANGLCVGRHVFQHPRPQVLLRQLADCIKGETERVVE
ncbi:MAG: hypothetical protein NWQ13_02490, partial [Glaciimonas sp.]|nr:hypothetical protein [Glaciimonas sp.]